MPDLSFMVPLLILGAGLGLLGGLFGIGGGIIAIPLLVMFGGLEQATAQGTALVMMVPNLLLAWWRYARRNPVDLHGALGVAVVGTLTTWGTAHFAQSLDQRVLRSLFALFLLYLAVRTIRPLRLPEKPRFSPRWLPLVGLIGGSCMGLLGVGGGLVATPVMTRGFALGQRTAQSMALALVSPSSAMALATYAQHDRVDWMIGIALGLGGLGTVGLGVSLAHSCSERTLQVMFGWMMGVTSLWLLLREML